MKFFSYDPGGSGFCEFDSREEALEEVSLALEEYIGSGNIKAVDSLCWGVIKQEVDKKNRKLVMV